MRNLYEKLLEALKNSDLEYFSDALENNTLTPCLLSNQVDYNIFHCLADNFVPEKTALMFFDKAVDCMKTEENKELLRELLNTPIAIQDKSTPLHLAITRGLNRLAKKYIEQGADPRLKNDQGRNSVHLCAETGSLGLFMAVQSQYNLDLGSQDKKNLTPLHLAISQRHEEMALLIISLTNNLKINADSALEMAVDTGSYRITRHLLLNRNEESLDLEKIKKKCEDKDIIRLLKKSKKLEKSRKYFFILMLGIVLKECCMFYQIYNLVSFEYFNVYFIGGIVQGIDFILLMMFMFLVSYKNPGYEENKSNLTLNELYTKYLPEYICPYCQVKKHKNTKHCMTCKKCVKEFDHHCIWVNNCIGKSNFKIFTVFLILLSTNITMDLIFYCTDYITQDISIKSAIYQVSSKNIGKYLFALGFAINFIMIVAMLSLILRLVRKIKINCKKEKDAKEFEQVSLEYTDYLKDFKDKGNEETSDTTSMLLKESLTSEFDSGSSSFSFISQFAHNVDKKV